MKRPQFLTIWPGSGLHGHYGHDQFDHDHFQNTKFSMVKWSFRSLIQLLTMTIEEIGHFAVVMVNHDYDHDHLENPRVAWSWSQPYPPLPLRILEHG